MLSSWGSSNYRPSAPFLYEVASHVKNCHFGDYYYYYYYYYHSDRGSSPNAGGRTAWDAGEGIGTANVQISFITHRRLSNGIYHPRCARVATAILAVLDLNRGDAHTSKRNQLPRLPDCTQFKCPPALPARLFISRMVS